MKQQSFEYRGAQISIGEARRRRENRQTLPSGKTVPAPLCYNCAQPTTAFEINSCGQPKCNDVLKPLHRWSTNLAARVAV